MIFKPPTVKPTITEPTPAPDTFKAAIDATNALLTECAEWKRRALALLEIVAAVGELSEAAAVSKVGAPRWTKDYDALLAVFRAFRAFTERGVPADWVLAGDGDGAVDGAVEEDIDF